MILYLIISFFVLLVTYWYVSKPKNLPPGPSGLPIIGYLPWFLMYASERALHFTELGKIYGDIITIRIGFSYVFVLNSYDVIKEAFVHKADAFSGRPLPVIRNQLTKGKGLLTAEGFEHRTQRRFLLRILRDFGFGKIFFEQHILTEVEDLCNDIDNSEQKDLEQTGIDLSYPLSEHVANNITAIVFGRRLEKPEIKLLVKQLSQAGLIPAGFIVTNAMPNLMFFSEWPLIRKYISSKVLYNLRHPLELFTLAQVKEHHKNYDEDVLSDVIHTYIAEQKKHEEADDAYWWDDEQIKHISVELLIAGTETTKSSILWGLIYLSIYPEIQKRVQEEIDSVVGRERNVSLRDQPDLPFVEALMLEILRYTYLVPTAVPHSTTEEAQLRTFTIPKNCMVLPNTYQVSRDPSVWPKPDSFDPAANFLSEDGKTVINRDKIIPFSIGRRSCIGESLAKMEIFLFLSNLYQRYNIEFPKTGKIPNLSSGTGLFRNPFHSTFIFKKRY